MRRLLLRSGLLGAAMVACRVGVDWAGAAVERIWRCGDAEVLCTLVYSVCTAGVTAQWHGSAPQVAVSCHGRSICPAHRGEGPSAPVYCIPCRTYARCM